MEPKPISSPDFQHNLPQPKLDKPESELPCIAVNVNGTVIKIFKNTKELKAEGEQYHQVALKDFATISQDFSYETIRGVLKDFQRAVPYAVVNTEPYKEAFKELWFKAIESKNDDLIEALLRYITLDLKDKDGNNVLHHLIKQGNVELLDYLIKHNSRQIPSMLFEKNNQGKNLFLLAQEIPDTKAKAAIIALLSNWNRDFPEVARQLDVNMQGLVDNYWSGRSINEYMNHLMDRFNNNITTLQQLLEYHHSEKNVDKQVMVELKSDLDILSNLVSKLSSEKTISESDVEAISIAHTAVQAQINNLAEVSTTVMQKLKAVMSALISKSVDNVSLSRREGETKSQHEETADEYQKRLLDYYHSFNTQIKVSIRYLNSLIQGIYPEVDQKVLNLRTKLLDLREVIKAQIKHVSDSSTMEFESEKKYLAEIDDIWKQITGVGAGVISGTASSSIQSDRPVPAQAAEEPAQDAEEIYRDVQLRRIANDWKNNNPVTALAFANTIAYVQAGKFPKLEEELDGQLSEQSKFISLVLLVQLFESPATIDELGILRHSKLDELKLAEQIELLPAAENKKVQELQKEINATKDFIEGLKVPLKTDSLETQEQYKKQISQLKADNENRQKELKKIIEDYKTALTDQMKKATKALVDAFKESQQKLTLQDFVPSLLGEKHEPTDKDSMVDKVFILLTKVASLAAINRVTYNAISQKILSHLIRGTEEEQDLQDIPDLDEEDPHLRIERDVEGDFDPDRL